MKWNHHHRVMPHNYLLYTSVKKEKKKETKITNEIKTSLYILCLKFNKEKCTQLMQLRKF